MQKINTNKLEPEYRPDEKMLAHGADTLSDAELLAVILRTGSKEYNSVELARKILTSSGDKDTSVLNIFNYNFDDLCRINGVGRVKALKIMAVAELSGRIARSRAKPALSFHSAESIARYYMEQMRHEKTETVMLLFLNSSCRLLRDMILSTGSVNESVVSCREIFINALKYEAVSLIIMHNHPSGDPTPSKADIAMTEQLEMAGRLIGIELLDHIIIGDNRYFSFRERGKDK